MTPWQNKIQFILNDRIVTVDFSVNTGLKPTTTVLNYLRSLPDHKGVKEGCAEGDCGACTVVIAENNNGKLSYKTIDSCLVFLPMIHGKQLITVENLADSDVLHPVQQEITLELCEPDHPLVKAFGGKSFVHIDEPYLFNKAYTKKNFRPLLYMDSSKLTNKNKEIDEKIKYVSWIKSFGKGRVFYVSPSHNAQSFEDVRLVKFYLDGLQYVLGDLKCDDSSLIIK